jgi:outer membrane protein assembly factor BamB
VRLAPPPKNVWDSPLLLIGGGILGVIVIAFGVLLYALTRGSAAEMFGKAEEEYKSGAYTSAMTIYEKFFNSYPDDPNASLARVRHGMAMLRQVTDDGKNPRLGLQTAQQVLPKIENEEKFTEARSELSTILPDIADGFATQSSQTTDVARREELAKLARQALELVNNPAYIPASLRKERESRIARILDKLQGAERGIEQDHKLATAVAAIAEATKQGDAGAAYAAHEQLLKSYPALETNAQLVTAMRAVGERERELVTINQGGQPPPVTQDHSPGSMPSVLAFREGTPPADSGQGVFVLAEGAVYGLDAGSGRLLWRRFVGYETTAQPVAIPEGRATDAVLIDARRKELVRVGGQTGELVWRLSLGEQAFGPVIVGNNVFVTTRKGRVLAIEAATGKMLRSAQLPQAASIAIASQPPGRSDSPDAGGKLYQLGDHSTLFVLDAATLACQQTVYLGHKAGTILVPPVAVLDHLVVIESPGDDYSTLRVLAPDAKSKRLTAIGRPLRLKGRVSNPPAISGARLAAITDLGQMALYTVDAASEPDHLRLLAGLDASEAAPLPAYCELDQNRLWVAMRRRTMFEVQPALGQLARRFTENEDDTFLGPPQLRGEMQVLVRRRKGASGMVVEGRRAASSESLWATHLASPIVALAGNEAREDAHALTADGRLFTWNAAGAPTRMVDKPAFTPPGGGAAIFRAASFSPETQQLVWTETADKGRVFRLDVSAGGVPASISLPGRAAAPAIALGKGCIAPLAEGSIACLAAESTEPQAAPFVPPLEPAALPAWSMPVALGDQATCLISDGRSTIYALARKEQPQPYLAAVGQSQPGARLVSPLMRAGSTVIGIVRQEASDAIAGFDNRAAPAFEPLPLKGRYEAGPFAVGGLVLVTAEPDGLVCCGADGRIRWSVALENGPLAGPPIANSDGDLVIAFQSGMVCLWDAASGKELARHDVGEPLSGTIQFVKSGLLLSGSDGVVHRIDAPRRP